MVAVAAPAKVLVSGASGFLGTTLSQELLANGYTVVGTVRSPSKGEYLKDLFKEYEPRFSYAIVPDIAAEGAFDEVIREGNFDAVEHTASPFHFHADDPSDLIGPAVKGTTGTLKSIAKNGPTVKRVIVTSSVASMVNPPHFAITEKDWNTTSPAIVDQQGKNAPKVHWYLASKTLAERAAWAFMKEGEEERGFDLATVCPSYIFGPPTQQLSSPKQLNESASQFMSYILHTPPEKETTRYHQNAVDVRDVALVHRLALEKEEAGGERFIASSGPFAIQQFYNALNEAHIPHIPAGYPSTPIDYASFQLQDGSKAERVLGFKYRSLSTQAIDTAVTIRARWPDVEEQLGGGAQA